MLDFFTVLIRLTMTMAFVSESVAHDTWKLILAVSLLNKTSGNAAIPVFWQLISTWSTPKDLSQGE